MRPKGTEIKNEKLAMALRDTTEFSQVSLSILKGANLIVGIPPWGGILSDWGAEEEI